jgi:hypothetical protein
MRDAQLSPSAVVRYRGWIRPWGSIYAICGWGRCDVQQSWVKNYVNGSVHVADASEEEELLIALPG